MNILTVGDWCLLKLYDGKVIGKAVVFFFLFIKEMLVQGMLFNSTVFNCNFLVH